MHTPLLLFSFRHNLQLGGHLHPSHQQRLEPHRIYLDHQLLQRAGGSLPLSLAEKTHLEKRPQKPNLLHELHGDPSGSRLPAACLPPAGVYKPRRPSLRLREAGAFTGKSTGGEPCCCLNTEAPSIVLIRMDQIIRLSVNEPSHHASAQSSLQFLPPMYPRREQFGLQCLAQSHVTQGTRSWGSHH